MEGKKTGFFERAAAFVRSNKRAAVALVLLAVGLFLVLSGGASSESAAEGDALEAQLEQMCSSLSGVGSCRVMLTYRESTSRYGAAAQKRVESVAVVCRGADKAGVRRELTDMLSALFGIGANRIHISKMK